MLYLEDYLELIENLPMEMRERFTDMREADLEVQNTVDNLDEKTKAFFKKCLQSNVKQDLKDEQLGKIKEEYKKALEQADEKVQIASQIYDMVDRHLRRLDVELSKFKMELEADNAGITELLEKRSLELDNVPKENNPPREKRKYTFHQGAEKRRTQVVPAPDPSEGSESRLNTPSNSNPNSPTAHSQHSTSSLTYNLGHVGAQSNPVLRAAASQAIAVTQHMQQGRRTSSLKASIESAKNADTWPALTESLSYSSQSEQQLSSRSQRVKKHTQKAEALLQAQKDKKQQVQPLTSGSQSIASPSSVSQSDMIANVTEETVVEEGVTAEWATDPNEPRYCLCNQVSYGEMVGCDNGDCPLEWFHYGCVGLTQAPKGKWYCPQCTAAMKRRGRKGQ